MRREAVVIDAAALLDLLVATDVGRLLDLRLEGCLLHAPAHIDAEVVAGLGRLERDGVVGRYRALELLESMRDAPIERHPIPTLLEGVWGLRHQLRHQPRLGDGLYLELARSLGLTLVTTDPRLAGASHPMVQPVGRE